LYAIILEVVNVGSPVNCDPLPLNVVDVTMPAKKLLEVVKPAVDTPDKIFPWTSKDAPLRLSPKAAVTGPVPSLLTKVST